MLKILVWGVLIWLISRVLARLLSTGPRTRSESPGEASIDEMVQDPRCGTYVPVRDAHRRVIGGTEYRFCSKECADAYEAQART